MTNKNKTSYSIFNLFDQYEHYDETEIPIEECIESTTVESSWSDPSNYSDIDRLVLGQDFKLRQWEYHPYINSDDWRLIRNKVMYLAHGKCSRCGGKADHVHHKQYNTLGFESTDELEAVCDPCHRKIHSIYGIKIIN